MIICFLCDFGVRSAFPCIIQHFRVLHKRTNKQAVMRQEKKISCTTWIKRNLYLIYIRGDVLNGSSCSLLLPWWIPKGVKGIQQTHELLVTCLKFTFISTQCAFKCEKMPLCCMYGRRTPVPLNLKSQMLCLSQPSADLKICYWSHWSFSLYL